MYSAEQLKVYSLLADVKDPEVPVLSILDLGIVRNVEISDQGGKQNVHVYITPTYSGCPAMDAIAIGIRMALTGRGFGSIQVTHQLQPAWTTDWMTEEGKRKLKEYGIAPPQRKSTEKLALFEEENIACPRCESTDTQLVSRYGPTSCKSLYKCNSCLEPFEHFKCH